MAARIQAAFYIWRQNCLMRHNHLLYETLSLRRLPRAHAD
jgi:hypothetical protein